MLPGQGVKSPASLARDLQYNRNTIGKMTLKDFLEAVKDLPLDTQIDKWNTNYGMTVLNEVKYEVVDGKPILTLF